jgi:hypothetical protein
MALTHGKVARANGYFSPYEECQSEMDANGKKRDCKVSPMPMRLSGY